MKLNKIMFKDWKTLQKISFIFYIYYLLTVKEDDSTLLFLFGPQGFDAI